MAALTVNECVYQELPSEEMLNDYIFFSRQVQQNAVDAGEPAHACFKIDGTYEESGGLRGMDQPCEFYQYWKFGIN